jgi:integrase
MALRLIAPGTRKGNKFYLVLGDDERTGKRVEKTTKCVNRRDAEAWLRNFLKDEEESAEPVPAARSPVKVVPLAAADHPTMADAVLAYAKSRGLDLDYRPAAGSVLRANSPFSSAERDEIRRLNRLRHTFATRPVADIVPDEVITLANSLDLMPDSKNREVIAPASAVLTYARKALHWREAPPSIPRFKPGKRKNRIVSQGAEAALLAGTRTPQQRRLVLWLFCQGTRITETLDVRWAAAVDDAGIDLDRRMVRMRVKGGEIKEFPLADELVTELQTIPVAERHGKLFGYGSRQNVYRWLTPLAAKHGFHFTPHQARHTVGTRANAAGAGLRTIMDMLGHTDIRSSMRYQSSDIEVTRSAVNLLRAPKRANDAA